MGSSDEQNPGPLSTSEEAGLWQSETGDLSQPCSPGMALLSCPLPKPAPAPFPLAKV